MKIVNKTMKKILLLLTLMFSFSATLQAANEVQLNITRNSNTEWTLSVCLTNTSIFAGFQMDLVLPQEVMADTTTLVKTSRIDKIATYANFVAGGNLRIAGYSTMRTRNITAGSGEICSIKFRSDAPLSEGTYEVRAKNIRCTSSTTEFLLPGVTQTFNVSGAATYTLTYWDGNNVYQTFEVAAGDSLPTVDEPSEREGYSFCGWGEVPEVMPQQNLDLRATWCVRYFTLSCMAEGKLKKTISVAYGTPLQDFELEAPEGYSFCGWTDAPELMPASDLTINAKICVNYYKVYYMVQGDTIRVNNVAYGAPVPFVEPEEREGYTFAGWEDVPETMPAGDLDLLSLWTTNSYDVNYYIDGILVHTQSVLFGEEFELYDYTPENPKLHVFKGWQGTAYDTMPAHDIDYQGSLTFIGDVNLDGKVNSADVTAVYNYIIKGEDSGILLNDADVNADNQITTSDIISIYNTILGVQE